MTTPEPLSLDIVRNAVVSGRLSDGLDLARVDCDALLDARDGEPFESVWLQSKATVDEAWTRESPPRHDEFTVEWVRRTMFLSVSRATGQHEIASAVSDDLELIARAAAAGLRDAFVLSLWDSYRGGEIPASVED